MTLGLSQIKSAWTVTVTLVGSDKCKCDIGTVQSLFRLERPNVTFTPCQEKQPGKTRCGCLERPDIHTVKMSDRQKLLSSFETIF